MDLWKRDKKKTFEEVLGLEGPVIAENPASLLVQYFGARNVVK